VGTNEEFRQGKTAPWEIHPVMALQVKSVVRAPSILPHCNPAPL
jgi:hypothetical protein